ncbi:right-handed parallel beta-helix repeat-containing protein [Teredinibacter franksiae]|uniref:right-handed parallel beta-helix repeat-containing protein n=1 Tax=Teredinibacter franksiae TaxID=2761453 RepID=UPI001628587A|nr:right-handed parallel beta-helix repeat-containing protein [Teredinibacter franksiae]
MRRFLAGWFIVLFTACGGGGSDGESAAATSLTPTTVPSITPTLDPNPTPTLPPLEWPIEEGRFGTSGLSFTLPGPRADGGLYLPDVQASYPDVDWQAIDRLYIQAGHYSFLRLGNLPERTETNRLIITNIGGQVRVGGLGHYYMLVVSGGSNWVLTGRYDAQSETGDIDFPGHRGGQFTHTQDQYGIMVDDDFVRESVSGLSVSDASNFEVEYVEIKEVGFAGMTMKTDNNGDAVMDGVLLHDNYIHDTGSEGLYIGSTQAQPQHQIRDWQIYNNRILRTGTEAIQLGQLGGHNEVRNNVFGPAAMDWRAAFQTYQDNNFQIGIREGFLNVQNNIFIGSADSSISFFAHEVDGDETDNNVGVTFESNYFTGIRNFGMYMNNRTLAGMTYRFSENAFGGYHYMRDEVYNHENPGHLLRIANGTTPIELVNNTWFGPQSFTNSLENNGVSNNIQSTNNTNVEPEALSFVDSGLPDGFNYLTLEMWTSVSTLGDKNTVTYQQNDVVMHLGLPYRCDVAVCESGMTPPDHSDLWTALPAFADDVRIVPGTVWSELGIQR